MTESKLLTVEQVAVEFQLTSQTIRNWIKAGTLPAVRIGHVYRLKREHVDALLDRANADSESSATQRDVWSGSMRRLPRRSEASELRSVWDSAEGPAALAKRD
jgi:excisionase family DNA binding protein